MMYPPPPVPKNHLAQEPTPGSAVKFRGKSVRKNQPLVPRSNIAGSWARGGEGMNRQLPGTAVGPAMGISSGVGLGMAWGLGPGLGMGPGSQTGLGMGLALQLEWDEDCE